MLVAQVCNSAANHLPTLFLGSVFTAALTGAYTLGNRAMTMVDLLATAVGQAFYPKAAKIRSEGGDNKQLLKITFRRLLFFALFFFPLAYLVAPAFFAFVFGPEWRLSGELIRLVLPLFFTRFIFVPAGMIPMILERQNWYLYRQTALFVLVLSSLWAGYYTGSYRLTLVLYSLAYSVCYLADGVVALMLMNNREPKFLRAAVATPMEGV